MTLYPLLFEPNLHTVVWGGDRLCPYKGLKPQDTPIGESWEVSAVPLRVTEMSDKMGLKVSVMMRLSAAVASVLPRFSTVKV